jgi:hypothetical protein
MYVYRQRGKEEYIHEPCMGPGPGPREYPSLPEGV